MGEKNQEKFSSSGESGNLNRMLPETQLETITKVVGDIKKKIFVRFKLEPKINFFAK